MSTGGSNYGSHVPMYLFSGAMFTEQLFYSRHLICFHFLSVVYVFFLE